MGLFAPVSRPGNMYIVCEQLCSGLDNNAHSCIKAMTMIPGCFPVAVIP